MKGNRRKNEALESKKQKRKYQQNKHLFLMFAVANIFGALLFPASCAKMRKRDVGRGFPCFLNLILAFRWLMLLKQTTHRKRQK